MPDPSEKSQLINSLTQVTPIFSPSSAPDTDALELAYTIAAAAEDRKGSNISILQMNEVSYIADFFVLVTGFSAVQVRAISRAIEDAVDEHHHRQPLRVEGKTDNRWVLQDFGEVIVHIFLPDEREFYNLDAFWAHATPVPFPPQTA